MDYNYVRMRNALRDGDTVAAEKYRQLYEKRIYKKEDTRGLNILLAVLFVAAIALGIYIAFTINKNNNDVTPVTEATTEQPAEAESIGDLPVVGSETAAPETDGATDTAQD